MAAASRHSTVLKWADAISDTEDKIYIPASKRLKIRKKYSDGVAECEFSNGEFSGDIFIKDLRSFDYLRVGDDVESNVDDPRKGWWLYRAGDYQVRYRHQGKIKHSQGPLFTVRRIRRTNTKKANANSQTTSNANSVKR